MILCRCLESHAWPEGRLKEYIAYVKPVGYSNTSSICGTGHCDNPSVIWLEDSDVKAYQNGQRIFLGPSYFVKVRADNSGVKFKEEI